MSKIADTYYGNNFYDYYPERPGFKEPTTSRAAAVKITSHAKILSERIMVELARHPAGLTADECASAINETVLATRPRLSELKQLGKIERTGERRKNISGMSAHVFRVREH